MIMKKTITVFAALLAAAVAFAQNVNQTVQVENDYVSQLSGLQKSGVGMSVPDSLLRFDYKFDYSVFDTPYKGAYEFSPYHIHVQPEASRYEGRKFYLKAGAGYAIRPVLEFTAAPVVKENVAVSLYNVGGGLYGRYRGHELAPYGTEPFTGYDFSDRFGVESRWMHKKFSAKLGAAYDFIWTGDNVVKADNTVHSVAISGNIGSSDGQPLFFRLDASGRFTTSGGTGVNTLTEESGSFGGSVGQGKGAARILLDFNVSGEMMEMDVTELELSKRILVVSATPHYDFTFGSAGIRAGVRVDYSDRLSITPDVRVSGSVLDGALFLYAGADGGQSISDYFHLKSSFHRAGLSMCIPSITKERMHAFAGLNGSAGHHFQFGLQGGWRYWASKPTEALTGFNDASVSLAYIDGCLSWKSERFEADGNFRAAKSGLEKSAEVFSTPSFSGDFRAIYNWNKRIFGGVWAEGQTGRKGVFEGVDTSLPSFVNLGLSLEFKASSRFGVWAEAGNLLGQEIWRVPVLAEKDPYVTAGITLIL